MAIFSVSNASSVSGFFSFVENYVDSLGARFNHVSFYYCANVEVAHPKRERILPTTSFTHVHKCI